MFKKCTNWRVKIVLNNIMACYGIFCGLLRRTTAQSAETHTQTRVTTLPT